MMKMNTKRIMSKESNVYHREYCNHISKIKPKNRMIMTWKDAQYRGYRACRCCNTMSYLVGSASRTLEYHENEHGMEFKLHDGMLFVKTKMGCWRLVYIRTKEQIALYHRNKRQKPLDWEHPERSKYHPQKDQLYYNSVKATLDYIYEHDKFRAAEQIDKNNVKYKNKRYQKQAENREKRAKLRKVNQLFRELEKQDKKLVKYSIG